jgi:hypothetical protein
MELEARTNAEPAMAVLLYLNHLIVASSQFNNTSGSWDLWLSLHWNFDGNRGFKILDSKLEFFETKEEAEQSGLAKGKEWVDKRNRA